MNLDQLKVILVPTDFSDLSQMALATAIQMARAFQASITVLHVDVDPSLVLPPPADVVSIPLVFESMRVDTSEKLEAVAEQVRRAGVACTAVSNTGRTHAAIVEQARQDGVGLIVMGSHARHGFSHALLGSVAEKVVEYAPCPVLVVPSAGRG
ncbi:MAG: universal stress protein [Bacteroidota bacterium]